MTALFQQLPSVDKFLKTPEGEMLLTEFGHSAVVRELRQLLSEGREFIKEHQNLPHFFADHLSTLHYLQERLTQQNHVQIKSVHNLTGTVLHTNLGRALWSESAQQAALHAMKGNVALNMIWKKANAVIEIIILVNYLHNSQVQKRHVSLTIMLQPYS